MNLQARTENPQNVEKGKCTNSTLYGGDPCFALQIDLDLKAGEEKEVNIFLGTAMTEDAVKASVHHCREKNFVDNSYKKLCESWDNYLSKFQCELPDKDTQLMINVWNPYQAERNFQFYKLLRNRHISRRRSKRYRTRYFGNDSV